MTDFIRIYIEIFDGVQAWLLSNCCTDMDRVLRHWSWRMMFCDHASLGSLHLEALFQIMSMHLYPSLIKAAIKFWDPRVHVFRFGEAEICPTVEEFRACLIYPYREGIFKPKLKKDYTEDIKNFFGWNKKEMDKFVVHGRLNVSKMIEAYAHLDTKNTEEESQRRNVYVFCKMARTLLRSSQSTESPAIIELIIAVRGGIDIIPTILAETLKGLDRVAKGSGRFEINRFSGSPYLLQYWLCERLGLISELEVPMFASFHYERRMNVAIMHEENDWPARLQAITAENIRWRCDWWTFNRVIMNTFRNSHVQIMGLTHSTFYSPRRLSRQFGILQEAFEEPDESDTPKELTSHLASRIVWDWSKRNIIALT